MRWAPAGTALGGCTAFPSGAAERGVVALHPVLRLHGYDAAPQRITDQVSLGAQVQFTHEVATVSLNRTPAEEEGRRDLRAGQPPRRQMQPFALACREGFIRVHVDLWH